MSFSDDDVNGDDEDDDDDDVAGASEAPLCHGTFAPATSQGLPRHCRGKCSGTKVPGQRFRDKMFRDEGSVTYGAPITMKTINPSP